MKYPVELPEKWDHIKEAYHQMPMPADCVIIHLTFTVNVAGPDGIKQLNSNDDDDQSCIELNDNLQNWLDKNTTGSYCISPNSIWFELEEDALAFKLVWE